MPGYHAVKKTVYCSCHFCTIRKHDRTELWSHISFRWLE